MPAAADLGEQPGTTEAILAPSGRVIRPVPVGGGPWRRGSGTAPARGV